jgi:Reverse transcriptase (RNA-dependent DNA polymerase)
MSRAQKGFTGARNIQEVLINVVEGIGHAKTNNLKGAVVSLDMAKAFDTISFKFLSECYKFFNLGPAFINVLETVGNSRTACIIMDDGSLSEHFDLGSGRPQGEILSPIQYNICNQILLFKIELCPEILSLYPKDFGPKTRFNIPSNALQENDFFRCESERETDKCEGFADDNSVLTLADQGSIAKLENILDDFSGISGLKCNFEKSSITFIGDLSGSDGIVTRFSKTDDFILLGIKIDSKLMNLTANFEKAKSNIQKIINYWGRFNLSLVGRIQIAKTFLLSQVNYFGYVLMPNEDDLEWMQTKINDFCTGNLRIAKEKLFVDPAHGGIGLINLKDSLISQQAIWFKKANFSTRDNWRWDLWDLGSGNCFTVPELDPVSRPILACIAKSFRKFLSEFYKIECNILDAYILNNPLISPLTGFSFELNERFWLSCGAPNIYQISRVRVRDLLESGKIKSLPILNASTGINLPANTYLRLTGVLHKLLLVYECNGNKKSCSIEQFFARFKTMQKNSFSDRSRKHI